MDKQNCYVCAGTNHLFTKQKLFFQSFLNITTYPCTLLTLNNGHIIMKILKFGEEEKNEVLIRI